MKWIAFVETENYKILQNSRTDFEAGMNVITGPSDTGKSTLLKGIKKCLHNKPDVKGESLLTWGSPRGSKVKIRVGIKDDSNGNISINEAPLTVIERVMGKGSINEYNIIWPDKTVTNYSGFGKKVPPEVLSVHGMREVDMGYGKEYLNLLGQFDGFFLLGRRPEDIATALGRLAHTDIIDKVKADLRSDITTNTRSANILTADIEKEQSIVDSFSYLKDVKDGLDALDDIRESIKRDEALADDCEDLRCLLNGEADKLRHACDLLEDNVDYAKAIELLSESADYAEKAERISHINERGIKCNAEDLEYVCSKLVDPIDFKDVQERIDELLDMFVLLDELRKLNRRLRVRSSELSEIVIEDIDVDEALTLLSSASEDLNKAAELTKLRKLAYKIARQLSDNIKRNKEAQDAYHKAKLELKESMEGHCPVCGGEIDEDHLDNISMRLNEQ